MILAKPETILISTNIPFEYKQLDLKQKYGFSKLNVESGQIEFIEL